MMEPARAAKSAPLLARLQHELGRIRYRLLVVNLFLVLVPAAGLEFARTYERQLLGALERDMANQAVLVRAALAESLLQGNELGAPEHQRILTEAARGTRTRVRLVHPEQGMVVDSHRAGPPEGAEPAPPPLAPNLRSPESAQYGRSGNAPRAEPPIEQRSEIQRAFATGERALATRVARSAVFLFLAEPLTLPNARGVAGVVYVTRSTNPVLAELHRIRAGLLTVLGAAIGLAVLLTLLLSYAISRPIERLALAARRISGGESGVQVPVAAGGELRELALAFREMTEKLEARHRFISDFAADVAHEFKSPLTSIRGAAELLSEGADDDPEARRRFVRNIELDAERLERLVARLLELSRIETSEESPQLVDLRLVLERAIDRSCTPDGPVSLRYGATVHRVRARESDLEAALVNLLDNALRFSPPGVPVTVDVSDRGAEQIDIRVTDEGPGIDPRILPRVFDRFFTTDADRDGTGLGLAIVQTVARSHGGAVSVQSEHGRGASFTFSLPVGVPRIKTRSGASSEAF